MKSYKVFSVIVAILYQLLTLGYCVFTLFMVYFDRPLWVVASWLFECVLWGALSCHAIYHVKDTYERCERIEKLQRYIEILEEKIRINKRG